MKTETKIVKFLIEEKKEPTIRELAKKIKSDYKIVHTAVSRLAEKGLVKKRSIGNSIQIKFILIFCMLMILPVVTPIDYSSVSDVYTGWTWDNYKNYSALWNEYNSNLFYTSGNVGIGTTNPQYILDVDTTVNANFVAHIWNRHATNGYGLLIDAGDDSAVSPFMIRNYDLSKTLFKVDGAGNVGIGTASPSTLLHINNAADSDFFTISQGANYKHSLYNYFSGTNSRLDFKIASGVGTQVNVMTLKGDGNVGIGTTSPGSNKLEVVGGPIKATGGLIIETRTSDPGSPATGQIWLRTDI